MNEDLWDRLQRMCEEVNPNEPNGGLQPPATPEAIAAAERAMNVVFPADLRQAYLRFNGTGPGVQEFRLLPGNFGWLGIGDVPNGFKMVWTWQFMSKAIEQDRKDDPDFDADRREVEIAADERAAPAYERYLDLSRILVASMATEDGVFVDTKPARAGTPGQLIYVDPQSPDCTLIAPSFSEAIRRLVSAYEQRVITFDAEIGWRFADGRGEVSLIDLARFS